MARLPRSEFWDFSLELYGREGVAPACLALQERHGADVNLLLFGCWLAASGRGPLEGAALARAGASVEPWHREIVRGLRRTRASLRAGSAPLPAGAESDFLGYALELRKKVSAIELEAEHIEQLLLAAAAPALAPAGAATPPLERARDAARSAKAYLAALGAPLDEGDRRQLSAILAPLFPALERGALDRLLAPG